MGNPEKRQLTLNKEQDDTISSDGMGAAVVERVKPQLRKPRMYRVMIINDDYTPMDFVVHVLEYFFGMGREAATRTMLKVHTEGKAVCGVFTRDIAETKAEQVNQHARDNDHPLLSQIEPETDSDV